MPTPLSTIFETTSPSGLPTPDPGALSSASLSPEQTDPPFTPTPNQRLEPDLDILPTLSSLSLYSYLPKATHVTSQPVDLEALEARLLAAFDAAVVQVQGQWAERVAELEEENDQLYEHAQAQGRIAQLAMERAEARMAGMAEVHEREREGWGQERARLRRAVGERQEDERGNSEMEVIYEPIDPGGARSQKKRRVSGGEGVEP